MHLQADLQRQYARYRAVAFNLICENLLAELCGVALIILTVPNLLEVIPTKAFSYDLSISLFSQFVNIFPDVSMR